MNAFNAGPEIVSGVQSADWVDIHFTVRTPCERAVPLVKKNAAMRHYVLRSLISLHNEHCVYDDTYVKNMQL